MKTAKKTKKASDLGEPFYDAQVKVFYGRGVGPRTGQALRCTVCGDFIIRLSPHFWSCERMFCGKLIPERVMVERFMAAGELTSEVQAYALLLLLEKPER